jgi:hypothetical protein
MKRPIPRKRRSFMAKTREYNSYIVKLGGLLEMRSSSETELAAQKKSAKGDFTQWAKCKVLSLLCWHRCNVDEFDGLAAYTDLAGSHELTGLRALARQVATYRQPPE